MQFVDDGAWSLCRRSHAAPLILTYLFNACCSYEIKDEKNRGFAMPLRDRYNGLHDARMLSAGYRRNLAGR